MIHFRHFTRRSARVPAPVILLVALLLLAPVDAFAQATAEARQMRHFWHVFAAYAIAWILLFGWLVSILKRIKRVEERLNV
jgi:CcmD family protein